MSDRTAHRDAQVPRRLLRGEESALGELYDHHAPLVHGLAWRLLDDQDDAEQLTREVFAGVWRAPECLDPAHGPLRDRLARLTRHRAAELLAARQDDGRAAAARATAVRVRELVAALPRPLPAPTHPHAPAASGRPGSLDCLGSLGESDLGAPDPGTPAPDGAPDPDDSLGPDEALRRQVLDWCLAQRPARCPVPPWAAPYAAETAKLDALLRDLGPGEWQEVAELPWHGGVQRWRPAEVVCHLAAVDGYLTPALGLPDPVRTPTPPGPRPAGPPRVPEQGRPDDVLGRTRSLIEARRGSAPAEVRGMWRRQSHELLRAAGLGADGTAPVDYGSAVLPLSDAFLDRAFECWVHGDDLARAVDYPYAPPAPQHLRLLVDLAARMLPYLLAALRGPDRPAGDRRLLRLVIDGPAAGEWRIPLDGLQDDGGPPVAEMVLDGLEFCYLAAAHRDPDLLPVGRHGDLAAIREVLHAVPLLSRP
ncbi:sigma factor [Kitasatospora sp. NPDC048540]|uniref:sigma factor n=1 Tax=Kitasatospora sp. NPDC048540 TaxID=3155634 RepID=UPI00340D52F9